MKRGTQKGGLSLSVGIYQIFDLIITEAQGTLIYIGDINVRLHPTLDTSKPFYTGEKRITKNIKLLMSELGLSDTPERSESNLKRISLFSLTHTWSIPGLIIT